MQIFAPSSYPADTALSFKKVLFFRIFGYFIAKEDGMNENRLLRIHFSDFQ